jgi:hypothetical protein
MLLPLLPQALLAIGISTLIIRIVIGYLVRPNAPRRYFIRFPKINARRIGRLLATLLYKRR